MTLLKIEPQQGAKMGLTYVELKLTNNGLFGNGKTATVKALVDTGASDLIVPREIAKQLGYDLDEAQTTNVRLADGRVVKAPVIKPINCSFQAVALGDDGCLIGVVPLQGMKLKVNPITHSLEHDPDAERV